MFRVLKTIITLLFIFELACTKVCANEFGVLSPTLTTLSTQLSTFINSKTSPFQLFTLPQTSYDVPISIYDETYYATPNGDVDANLLTLLSIYSSNELISVDSVQDALFEYEDTEGVIHYFSYNTDKMKKSAYDVSETNEESYDFTTSYFNSLDEVEKKYYKLSILSAYLSDHAQLSVSNSNADENIITVNLPNNKIYLKYDYVKPENYVENSERLVVEDNVSNVSNYLFNKISSSNENGGIIFNSSKSQLTITSDFTNNILNNASGGVIYNIGKTTVDGVFINNSVNGSSLSGGAILNSNSMYIDSEFIRNYVKGSNVSGGAVSNIAEIMLEKDAIIDVVSGCFIGNYVSATYGDGRGGAIYNAGNSLMTDTKINLIESDFISNFVESSVGASYGGAIYNGNAYTYITTIEGDFISNSVLSSSYARGGAIYNNASIEYVLGDFISNSSKSTNGVAMGGAVFNEKILSNLKGYFLFNAATGLSAKGGAIYNIGQLKLSNSEFINNFVNSSNNSAEGGAIYNSGILSLDGDLQLSGNYAHSTNNESKGGAIYNVGVLSGDLTGNFIENSAFSDANSSYGGTIYNNGYITNIFAKFAMSSINAKNSYGGAIYNSNSINNIKTSFVENTVESTSLSQGGVIFNKGSIYNISSVFDRNSAYSTKKVYGGAIYNMGDIHYLNFDGTTVFTQNFVCSATDKSFGGAVYNLGSILDITNTLFKDNVAKTEGVSSAGGAIYSEGYISKLNNNTFENNASLAQKGETPVGLASGGAVYNSGTINTITSSFTNNYAIGKSAQGGAIYNKGIIIDLITEFNDNYVVSSNGDAQGGAIYNSGSFSTGIKDTSFYNNYAISTNGKAYGGAIYTVSDLMVQSTSNVLVFQGNYIQTGNNEKIYQAIYVGNTGATLTLSSLGVSKIVLFDDIDGVTGFKTLMTGDETAEINLYNKISNSQVTLENLTFKYNVDTFSGENLSLYTNSGRMEMRDSLTNNYFVTELFSHENALYFIDVDPLAESIDKIFITNNASGIVTIEEINYLNKLTQDLILKVLETESEDITIAITHTVKDIVKELPNIVYNTDEFIQEEGASFHDRHTIKFLYHRRMDNLQLINEKIMVPNEEGVLDERFFIFKEDSSNDYKVLDTITTIGITTPGILNIVGCIVNGEISFLDFNNVEGFNLQNESTLNINKVKIVNSPLPLNLNNENAQAFLTDVVLAQNNLAILNNVGSVMLINSVVEKDENNVFENNVLNNGIMTLSNSSINTSVENTGLFITEQESTNVIYDFSNAGVANLFGIDTIYEKFNNTNEVNTSGSTIFTDEVVNYGIMNLSNHNMFEKLLTNQSSATISTLDSTEEQGVFFDEINNIGTINFNAENNVFNKNVLNECLMIINGSVKANALIDGIGLTTVNGGLLLLENSEFTLLQELNIGDAGSLTINGGKLTISTSSSETEGDIINGIIVGESGQLHIINSSIFERQLSVTQNSNFELNLTATSYDSTMNGISSIYMGLLTSDIDSTFKIDVDVENINNDSFVIHQDSDAVLNIVQLNGLTKDNMPIKHTIEFVILNDDTNAILYLDESPTGIIELYKTVSKLQDFYQPDMDMYLVTSNDYIGEKGIKLGETKKSIIAGDLTGYDELNILVELPKELTGDNPCTTRMFNVKETGYTAIKSAGVTASGVMTVYGDSEENDLYFVDFNNKHSGFNVSTYPTSLTLRDITIKNALSTVDNGNGIGAGLTVENSDSTIIIENVSFKDNMSTFAGGAIFNNGIITEIKNTSFIGNYVYNDGSSTPGAGLPNKECGGAIYSLTDFTLQSDHHTTLIQGNYTQFANYDKNYEAIYMGENTVLTFNAIQNGHFIVDDSINGLNGYSIVLSGDTTSIVELNNKVINADVVSDFITLKLAHNTFDNTHSTLTVNSGKVSTEDLLYQVYTIDDLVSVEGVEYLIDFNLFVDENDVLQYSTDKFKFTNSATGLITLSDTVLSTLGLDNRYSKLSQYLFTHKDSYYLVDLIEKTPNMDIILSMSDMVVNYNVEYYEFIVKSSDFIGEIGYRLSGTTGFEIGVLSYMDSLIATNIYSNPDVKRTFVFESNYLLTEDSLGVTGEGSFDILGNTFDLDFNSKQGFSVEGDSKLAFNIDNLNFKNSTCAISNTNTHNASSVVISNSSFDNNDVAISNYGSVTLSNVTTVVNDSPDKNMIINEGTLILDGNNTFNSDFSGLGNIYVISGETNLLNSLVIDNTLQVNAGVIKFGENTFANSNLVINGGNISINDFAYKAYNINNFSIESDFSVVIDINVNTKETDAFYVGEGSKGLITISQFSEPQVADFVERSEIKVLYKSNQNDSIRIALSDELRNTILAEFTIDDYFVDDVYTANDTDYICKIVLGVNEAQDSIVLKAQREGSVLSIFNQHQYSMRIFNIVSSTYTEEFDLGVTASGNMIVNGNNNVLDMNNHSGFIVSNKDTKLELNGVYIVNGYSSGNGSIINALNYDNIEINLIDTSMNQSKSDGLGGVIYSTASINIIAENSNVYFNNNRAQDNILNDIYLDNTKNTNLTLSLSAKEGNSIEVLSGIDFVKTGLTININGEDYLGEVNISGSLGTSSSKLINIFNVNGGTLSFIDDLFSDIYIKSLNVSIETKYAIDVDLVSERTDTIYLPSTAKLPANKLVLTKDRFNMITMFTKENDSAAIKLIDTNELTTKFFRFEETENDVICYDYDGVNYYFILAEKGFLVISRDNPDYFMHPLVAAIRNTVANTYEMSSDNLLYNYGSQTKNPTQNNVQSTSLTIKGNNYSIIAAYLNQDSNKLAGIAVSGTNSLAPSKQNLIIYDVTFKEFEQAIINKGGNVKLTNVNFENNNSDANGNAIYNESGTLTFTGDKTSYAYVYNNSSGANGGAVYNSGTMTVSYVDFGVVSDTTTYRNIAAQGGAIFNDGSLTLKNNNFVANTATSNGGAVYTTSTLSDTASLFKLNSANNGGAVYVASLDETLKINLLETKFYANNASVNGGALYVASGSVGLTKTIFGDENVDNENKAVNGGAVYNAGNLTATSAVFTLNQATKDGGAVYNNGKMTLIDSLFGNKDSSSEDITFANKANNGGAVYNNNDLTVKSTDFNANTATNGGALYNSALLTISESTSFNNNTSNFGGAIYNTGNAQLNSVLFNDNKVSVNIMTTSSGYGGAIYNDATGTNNLFIQKSTFTNNYAEKLGGAVYNKSNANIEIVSSTFTLNNATNQGGAVYNQGIATITGTTFGNIDDKDYVLSNASVEGGAIYNTGTMAVNSSNLYYNEADTYGGAIYNSAFVTTDTLTVELSKLSYNRIVGANGFGGALYNKTGTVNILGSTLSYNSAGKGGGIYNDGVLVVNNSGSTKTTMLGNIGTFGGAIYNNGTLSVTGALFDSNVSNFAGGALFFNIVPEASKETAYVSSTTFTKNTADFGGAVYAIGASTEDGSQVYNSVTIANSTFTSNNATTYGGAIYADTNSKITVIDTDFKYNIAGKDGGAIFVNGGAEVSVIAQSKDVIFTGNTANGISNDVYLNSYVDDESNAFTAILNLQTFNGKTITFDGFIDGVGVINIYGNTLFNESVIATGSEITLNHVSGTLSISNEFNLSGVSLAVNGGGGVNVANGAVRTLSLNTLSLADGTTSNISLDLGLKNSSSDKVQAEMVEGTGTLNVSSVNVVTNSKTPVEINVGKDSVVSSISTNKAESAEATYKLKSYYDENGLLRVVAYGQKAKPSAIAAPVAAQIGGYLTQINSYDQAFMNMDMNMLKTLEERNANSSACCEDRLAYSPEFTNGINQNGKGLWNRPFATFEKVNLNNGPKVSNVGYGNYFGGDAELKELSNGWKRQFSAYIGYNGSVQDYERQSIDQNGGTVGVTEVWYKNNFFTGLTFNAGANVAQAHTDLGRENMPMFMTGIASKTGYNFEFKDGKFIVQPSMLMSYSFIHTFAHDNGLGHRVSSSPLHAIQLAPGIKFIANLRNGWQPYFNINMRWNLIDKTHFSIPDVTIPDMSIDPYIEYGLGLQRRWGDRFTGYGQAMVRNGGRNGVILSFGFKWLLGD